MAYTIDKNWLLKNGNKEDKVVVSAGSFDYSMIVNEEPAAEDDEFVKRRQRKQGAGHVVSKRKADADRNC